MTGLLCWALRPVILDVVLGRLEDVLLSLLECYRVTGVGVHELARWNEDPTVAVQAFTLPDPLVRFLRVDDVCRLGARFQSPSSNCNQL